MLTAVVPPGCFVSVRSTGHQLFSMLVLQRTPLLVLLLLWQGLQPVVQLTGSTRIPPTTSLKTEITSNYALLRMAEWEFQHETGK